VADSCTKKGVTQFTDLLSEWSNSQGYCIEIGNGAWDSWFMPFEDQIEIACEKGNMVGRGVLEFCDGAPPS
nr:palmitoyl-protein thioesterase 1-like isoform X2 [Tanacetum cinerariifolium]